MTAIMDQLKSATAEQHANAERRRLQRALVSGKVSAETYRAWLGQMLLVHEVLWNEIAGRRAGTTALAAVVRDGGLHCTNLRSDLLALGGGEPVAPLPTTAAALAGIRESAERAPLELLGYNYVLEGSMNGNRFIARALAPAMPSGCTRYLDPYGDGQRQSWQEYRERMNAVPLDAGERDAISGAAGRMFDWISGLSDELVGEEAAA